MAWSRFVQSSQTVRTLYTGSEGLQPPSVLVPGGGPGTGPSAWRPCSTPQIASARSLPRRHALAWAMELAI